LRGARKFQSPLGKIALATSDANRGQLPADCGALLLRVGEIKLAPTTAPHGTHASTAEAFLFRCMTDD
jgi:hypothetical protein